MMLLGSAVEHTDEQVIDIQKLLAITTALDFNIVKQEGTVLEILQRLFPNLPPEKLAIIDKNATNALEARYKEMHKLKEGAKQSKKGNFYLKLSIAIAATVFNLYFGGAIAAKLTDSAFNRIYILLFGLPNSQSFTYSIIAPCKKFLAYLSNTYGPYVLAGIAGPTTYSAASIVESFYKSVKFLGTLTANNNTAPQLSTKTSEELAKEFELLMIEEKSSEEPSVSEVSIGDKKIEIFNNYRPACIQSHPASTQTGGTTQQKIKQLAPHRF